VHFLVPLISRETRAIFEEALYAAGAADLPLTVLFGHARERSRLRRGPGRERDGHARDGARPQPMVITYKMAALTARLMARMATVPYAGLPNIIAGEFVVPRSCRTTPRPRTWRKRS